jgi:hypothetical protein
MQLDGARLVVLQGSHLESDRCQRFISGPNEEGSLAHTLAR